MSADDDLSVRLALLRTERELRSLKAGLTEARKKSDHVEQARASLEAELSTLRNSLRYRLGSLLAELARGHRGWRMLPRLVREWRGKQVEPPSGAPPPGLSAVDLPPKTPPDEERVETAAHTLPGPPALPRRQSDLRVAVIMDPFSLASFGPECRLLQLHPERWLNQLEAEPPHVLLVESAWTGADGEWRGLVERAPPVLKDIVACCRQAGIPTVFWNKEDPLHFDAFLPTAKLFDHVFTTDAAAIPRYKRELGHDRVGVLPFALQPRSHHPIGDEVRLSSSVFAGAWYGNLPERCADFEQVVDALALAGPVVIHDRHDGQGNAHQMFPARYREMLQPAVPYECTPSLFRSHWIGINLNTIKQSPTMFARRALELIGCNTSVYGNHALGLGTTFGSLTVSSNEPEVLLKAAWSELRDPDAIVHRQRRLRALRKALSEHTWSHRLAAVANAAWSSRAPASAFDGRIWVIAQVDGKDALDRVVQMHAAQRGVDSTLALVLPQELELPPGAVRLDEVEPAADDWIALFHSGDQYGAHYLEDLALARAFGQGEVLGKASWFASDQAGGLQLQNPGSEYRCVPALACRRSLWRRDRGAADLIAIAADPDCAGFEGERLVSVDALNYVAGASAVDIAALEGPCMDEGAAWSGIEEFSAGMQSAADPAAIDSDALDGRQIAHLFNCGVVPGRTSASPRGRRLEICSFLDEGAEDAMFSAPLSRELMERDGRVEATLQMSPASQVHFYLDELDDSGRASIRTPLLRGVPARLAPAPGTAGYRIAVRLKGQFVRALDGIWLGGFSAQPLVLPGNNRVLLVCNGYPEAGTLYRNAFIHRRVLAYMARGVGVDVVWVSEREPPRSYAFEGVTVRVCSPGALAATLHLSRHQVIAVHMLDAAIWEGLADAARTRRVVVWLHGAEIQPWERRAFNYEDEQSLGVAKAESAERMAFWRELLANPPHGLHLVFVSRRFAEDALRDLGVRPPDSLWSVIHNPIDTDLFSYRPKSPEQRFRILSIRPHQSRIYANDLIAGTVMLLREHPLFESLQFTFVGDGPLWHANFGELSALSNVNLVRKFLTQQEIAKLHKQHGIFLVPTRGDTQGVSRDEAMASGLVPVTNGVGSVPEFVDEQSGIVCAPERPEALANAIIELASNPGYFQSLSANAADRVREQSGVRKVVGFELSILGVTLPPHRFESD